MTLTRVRITSAARAAVTTAAAFTLLLTGCSTAPSNGEETTTTSGGDFCSDYEEAGGSGATVGPVQVWLGRDEVLADVRVRLGAMNAVAPPSEVEAEWNAMKSHYENIEADFEAADPSGPTLTDSEGQPLVGKYADATSTVKSDYEAVTDYYFATC